MAVYTQVYDEDLESFLAHYDLGPVLAFKGIAEGVENSNFLLQTERGVYILTLYEKRVADEDLPFFLGLMEHLAAKGVPCPTPIAGLDGRRRRELNGRQAAVISFLEGLWPRRVEPWHCRAVGQSMARMHLAGLDFPDERANDLSVEGWRPLFELAAGEADEVAPGLARELEGELDVLEGAWPHDLPRGVIHADLFPDNVFFRGQRLSGLIDFYFACTDQLSYDLAICLNAWCFESDGAFNATKARALLQGYREHRRLVPAELDALPVLARGAAVRFLLTRLYDWLHCPPDALVQRKDPLEYRDKLRFHRDVRGPAAYGFD